jgi:hypothetical protein
MATDNHTSIGDYAPVNASTFNSPMGELDAAIGDLSSLTSAEKGSLVGAINEMLYGKSNRHLNLDGTDVPVLVSDTYLQIDSLTDQTNLNLPAISSFGVGRELKVMVTEAIVGIAYFIFLVANAGAGDDMIGGEYIAPQSAGCFIFRTVASYPGAAGACWLRKFDGESVS